LNDEIGSKEDDCPARGGNFLPVKRILDASRRKKPGKWIWDLGNFVPFPAMWAPQPKVNTLAGCYALDVM